MSAELPDGLIAASDISEKAVAAARTNLRALPHGERIAVVAKDYQQISRLENRLIVCNPPYGIRLDNPAELESWYKNFGDFLKQRCLNSQAYVYAGKPGSDTPYRTEAVPEASLKEWRP